MTQLKNKHYVWWIENKKKSGTGEYTSKKEEEKAKKSWAKLNTNPKQYLKENKIVEYEAEQCGCGRWTRKDILENLGICLSCDHLQGEVYE